MAKKDGSISQEDIMDAVEPLDLSEDELEELLITSDVGMLTTEEGLEDLQNRVIRNHVKDPKECKKYLIDCLSDQMGGKEIAYDFENKRSVILVIGVNGVGKTTLLKMMSKPNLYENKCIYIFKDKFDNFASSSEVKLIYNDTLINLDKIIFNPALIASSNVLLL